MKHLTFISLCVVVAFSIAVDPRQEFRETNLHHWQNCTREYGFSSEFAEEVRNGDFGDHKIQAKVTNNRF